MAKTYSKGNVGKFETAKLSAENKNRNKTVEKSTKVVNENHQKFSI